MPMTLSPAASQCAISAMGTMLKPRKIAAPTKECAWPQRVKTAGAPSINTAVASCPSEVTKPMVSVDESRTESI